MKQYLAVIDDDSDFLNGIEQFLLGRGYSVDCFSSFSESMQKMSEKYAVAIIDLNLIDGDGIELVQYFHKKFPRLKKIVITGQDTLPKRLRSFGLGADDYMMKPIFPCELEARVKRFFKEVLTLDMQIEGLSLTKSEAEIFSILNKNSGNVVSMSYFEQAGFTRASLYSTMNRLKCKLHSDMQIKTSYGRGWYLLRS